MICKDIAERHDLGIHTHLLESKVQTALAEKRYGCTMTQHLERLGLLSPRLSCAHTIWIEPEDIDRLAANGVVVVHNPESNLKLGTGIAPIGTMLERGVTVALGTDGSVSNDNLVMHEALRLAAMLNRTSNKDRTKWITARQPLRHGDRRRGGGGAGRRPDRAHRARYRADVVLYDLARRRGRRSTNRCSRWSSPRRAAASAPCSSAARSCWSAARSRHSTRRPSLPRRGPCAAPIRERIRTFTGSRADGGDFSLKRRGHAGSTAWALAVVPSIAQPAAVERSVEGLGES